MNKKNNQFDVYLHQELPDLLTREEEIELGKKLKSKNKKTFEEAHLRFVESNLRLVMKIAQDYSNYVGTLDFADIVNEGNIGLMMAVDRYDVDKGVKFSSYASYWIKHTIRKSLSNDSRTVRIPIGLQAHENKIKAYINEFTEKFGCPPTKAAIKKVFGVSDNIINHCLNFNYNAPSFNVKVGDLNSTVKVEWIDMFPDDKTCAPDKLHESNDEKRHLVSHLKCLSKRERRVISLRFGLKNDDPLTLEGVGEVVGVTRERIRQIVNDSLGKLKRSLAREERSLKNVKSN